MNFSRLTAMNDYVNNLNDKSRINDASNIIETSTLYSYLICQVRALKSKFKLVFKSIFFVKFQNSNVFTSINLYKIQARTCIIAIDLKCHVALYIALRKRNRIMQYDITCAALYPTFHFPFLLFFYTHCTFALEIFFFSVTPRTMRMS